VSSTQCESLDVIDGGAKRVTIIGAGIAGLVAAYELERRGHLVEILEGSGRIGGRIHTHRFHSWPDAPLVELGAMRIPVKHRRTMQYVARLELADKVRPFGTLFSDADSYCMTSAGYLRARDAAKRLANDFRLSLPDRRYSDETICFGAWLAVLGDAIAPSDFRESLRDEFRLELLDHIDQYDLSPFIRGDHKDQFDAHAFFAVHPEVRTSGNGRLNRFLDDVLSETGPDLVRLEGGMDQIVRRLAGRIRGPITCGQEVVGIDSCEDHVTVAVRGGDHIVTRCCDHVLCTIPFSVLRGLRLRGLSDDKMAVIHDARYWSATKIAFHCREPFWESDGISGGASFCGGRIRQTYYCPVDGDPDDGAALLASYTIGADADALDRLPSAVRNAVVLQELGKMHPELLRPGMVMDAVSLTWGRYWWSQGAACVRWGRATTDCERERRRAARPEHRLFFAGEHCSSTTAWIEGAIESALKAVHEIQFHQSRAGSRLIGMPRSRAVFG
jgi:monoamine oxidase